MLPDYPEIRDEISRKLEDFVRKRSWEHLGPGLNEISRSKLHEGDASIIVRPDGQEDETDFKEVLSEISIDQTDVPNLTLNEILTRLDGLAEGMARGQAEHIIKSLSDGVERVGNVVEGKAQPLSPELILEVFDKIQLDFDEDGKFQPLTMLGGSNASKAAEEAFRQLEEDPKLRKKWETLIQKKKEQWRAREADRYLAG